MNILEVKNLSVGFKTRHGIVPAVKDVSFEVRQGETLGIVGESGSGKSVSSLAVMGLLPPNAMIQAEKMMFGRNDLLHISEKHMRTLRGGDMGMIFQDPMTSLNPSFTIGYQLMEALRYHQESLDKKQRYAKAVELLNHVGISFPEARMKAYPHQLSGGMCQRVMIAMAIGGRPQLLIADEPTTALDVTIQAQILNLLDRLREEDKMSMILITHDLGVVAEHSDRVIVMYEGRIVETGNTKEVIQSPTHPYTQSLLSAYTFLQSEGRVRKEA